MSSSSTSVSESPGRARAFRRHLAAVAVATAGTAAAFLLLVWLAYGVRIDRPPDAVAARLLAKLAAAEAAEGPRILVFAGSSGLYNVRTATLSRATGRPAVNLATHAAQSLPFLAWQVRHAARRGDVVLLPLETAFLRDGGLTTYGVRIAHAAGLPLFGALGWSERLRYLRELLLGDLLEALAARLGVAGGLGPDDLSLRVTPTGDLVPGPPDRAELHRMIVRDLPVARPRIAPDAARRLRALAEWAAGAGVTLVFAPAGLADIAAAPAAETQRLAQRIEALGITTLNLPEDGVLPAEAMAETAYHASGAGAALYTARLVVALCDAPVGLDCASGERAAAERMSAAIATHGFVFGDDPRLAALRQGPVRLSGGETLDFAVAVPARCRSTLEIGGTGNIGVTGQRISEEVAPEGDIAQVALPARGGLLGLRIRAGDGGATLTRLARRSDCPRPRIAER